ncbi:MAG: hypothetical protein K0S93_1974 [Nitrososphaeraceae archaeon]|nr:hypothetical protein [Nitrososphaeraceae archaeon]
MFLNLKNISYRKFMMQNLPMDIEEVKKLLLSKDKVS